MFCCIAAQFTAVPSVIFLPFIQNKEQAQKDSASGKGDGVEDPKKAAPMSLPKGVVKKIVMLDEDQTRIAGDAVELLTRASEMFLSALATKSHDEAKGAARSTVNFRDIGAFCYSWIHLCCNGIHVQLI
jgi:histone H3/H4